MEFFDELFENESFSENILDYIMFEDQYTPIMESPLLPNTVETDEYLDLSFDSTTEEVNQNQGTLDLYQNLPEMQQQEQQNYLQVDNSLESPFLINILDIPSDQFYEEPISSTMMEIPQQFARQNNGFTYPNMIELSNLIMDQQLPLPLREENQNNTFGNYATSMINNFQNQHLQPNHLQASTFSTREPILTNQYQYPYNGNQNIVESLIPNWLQNLSSNQRSTFDSSYKPYGEQWQPLFRYPTTFNTQTNVGPYTNSFTSFQGIQDNVNIESLIHPLPAGRTISNNNGIVFGHQQQNQFEQGGSSYGQRMIAQRNVYPFASNPHNIRVVNKVYDPRYESIGQYIDPHFRSFFEINKRRGPYLMQP